MPPLPRADLLTGLTDRPVVGVDMANVAVLRLDRTGGLAPGNKHFKLRGSIAAARQRGISRLVSFGGAWSNHLHALAAIGREQGFATVGIVRGDEDTAESATLHDARAWGMQLVKVSRAEYRRRHEPAWLDRVRARFGPCLVVPEGGASAEGVRGSMVIAGLVRAVAPATRRIAVPVGTGTTLAGIAAGLDDSYELVGISALKGAADLERRVAGALAGCGAAAAANWRIEHGDHCGGFARVSSALRRFMLEFERVQGIALDPVYTGKMLFAIHQRLQRGEWDRAESVLAIHTGGLQGRRGFPWLAPEPGSGPAA